MSEEKSINRMGKLYSETRKLRIVAQQALETVLSIQEELFGNADVPEKWTSREVNYHGDIGEMTCAIQQISLTVKNTLSLASKIHNEIKVD